MSGLRHFCGLLGGTCLRLLQALATDRAAEMVLRGLNLDRKALHHDAEQLAALVHAMKKPKNVLTDSWTSRTGLALLPGEHRELQTVLLPSIRRRECQRGCEDFPRSRKNSLPAMTVRAP